MIIQCGFCKSLVKQKMTQNHGAESKRQKINVYATINVTCVLSDSCNQIPFFVLNNGCSYAAYEFFLSKKLCVRGAGISIVAQ